MGLWSTWVGIAIAQEDTLNKDMLELRVDDMYSQFKDNLLNQQVTIASKKIENLKILIIVKLLYILKHT